MIANTLLLIAAFFILINYLTAISISEKIIGLYATFITTLAIALINLNLNQSTLANLLLAIIVAKILLIIIITKFRK